MYEILKHSHLTALALSFLLFFVRGYLMMRESALSKHRALLIAPHIINLLLIGTGISLAVFLHMSPGSQPWLAVKLIALVFYIALGILTFKHPNLAVRKILWLLALIVFAFIVSVAQSKNPYGFFANIF
ncbi:MAG: regulator SirB [Gammaproteobacteria bacterium]|nr:MAG: regulator SirB [Gammaproteobacteria bacterium]